MSDEEVHVGYGLRRRVLLADDHPIVLEYIKVFLERTLKFNVVATVSDGRQVLAAARKVNPDLVIIDIDFGNTNGIDIIRRLRAQYESLRILVYTAHTASVYVRQAIDAGADYLVVKTTELPRLQLVIQQVANRTLTAKKIPTPCDPSELSSREFSILMLLVKGVRGREIADRLFISEKTVSTYKFRLFQKLNVASLSELVSMVLEKKMLG